MLQDRQVNCLKGRACIFQPGNFTCWGSEGVNVPLSISLGCWSAAWLVSSPTGLPNNHTPWRDKEAVKHPDTDITRQDNEANASQYPDVLQSSQFLGILLLLWCRHTSGVSALKNNT